MSGTGIAAAAANHSDQLARATGTKEAMTLAGYLSEPANVTSFIARLERDRGVVIGGRYELMDVDLDDVRSGVVRFDNHHDLSPGVTIEISGLGTDKATVTCTTSDGKVSVRSDYETVRTPLSNLDGGVTGINYSTTAFRQPPTVAADGALEFKEALDCLRRTLDELAKPAMRHFDPIRQALGGS